MEAPTHAAGMVTGNFNRRQNPFISMFETPESVVAGNRFTEPTKLPVIEQTQLMRSMKTRDIDGARPRSRPGLAHGNHTLPNGMYTQMKSQRSSNPLSPSYDLAAHAPAPTPDSQTIALRHHSYLERSALRGSTKHDQLNNLDIQGSSPRKLTGRADTSYSSIDYRDVTGKRRYEPRWVPRETISLKNNDIKGSHPSKFISPKTAAGGVGLNNWVNPKDSYTVKLMQATSLPAFGRVPAKFSQLHRDTSPINRLFVMPKCRQIRP